MRPQACVHSVSRSRPRAYATGMPLGDMVRTRPLAHPWGSRSRVSRKETLCTTGGTWGPEALGVLWVGSAVLRVHRCAKPLHTPCSDSGHHETRWGGGQRAGAGRVQGLGQSGTVHT